MLFSKIGRIRNRIDAAAKFNKDLNDAGKKLKWFDTSLHSLFINVE
jgi:hypothetical protein